MDVKKVLQTILRVYMIVCTALFSVLIVALLVVWINFGRIMGTVTEKIVDNYSDEITTMVSGYIEASASGDAVKIESIQTLKGGGIQASFVIDTNNAGDFDISKYQNKTTAEIMAEIGMSVNDIPAEIKPLFSMVKQTLALNFKDQNGNPIFNHETTAKEIAKLIKG